MSDYELNKRDPFLQEKFFIEQKDFFFNKTLPNNPPIPDWIKDDPIKVQYFPKKISWRKANGCLEYTLLLYSAGRPMSEVVEAANKTLDRFIQHYKEFKWHKFEIWEPDTYCYVLWLLSFAVLTNRRAVLDEIVSWISSKEHKRGELDTSNVALVDEVMVAIFKLLKIKHPYESNNKVLFAKSVYPLLAQIIKSVPNERPELMQQYLKGWYKTGRDCYWHGAHEIRGGDVHFGYWALETGMLTLLLDISDYSYRDLNFYPKDWVNYARQHGYK